MFGGEAFGADQGTVFKFQGRHQPQRVLMEILRLTRRKIIALLGGQTALMSGATLGNAGEPPAGASPGTSQVSLRRGVNVQQFDSTGTIANGTTLADAALAKATASGQPIYFPAGTYLLQQNHVLRSGMLFGDGIDQTVLHFQATDAAPVLAGLSIRGSNVHITDMTLQSDASGHAACAAIRFDTVPSQDVYINNCKFQGVSTKLHNWGIQISGADLTNLVVSHCRFDTLDLGVFKGNADASTTKFTTFMGCHFYNCVDCLEINQIVGPWTDVTVTGCTFDTIAQFPIGLAGIVRATVEGCHFTNCQLEAVHIEAESNGIKIIGNDFQKCNLTPGAVGAVSVITGSYNILVQGNDFDLTQNPTGSPFGVTVQPGMQPLKVTFSAPPSVTGGMISSPKQLPGPAAGLAFSAYPYNFILAFCDGESRQVSMAAGGATLNWTDPLAGSPTPAASVALAPYNVSVIGNTFRTKAGAFPAIRMSMTLGATVANNLFMNYDPASKAVYFMDVCDSVLHGAGNTFINPAVLLHIDDNSYGTLSDTRIDGDLAQFGFVTGNTSFATSVCFDGFSIRRAFTSAAESPANVMFPAGSIFDVTVAVRFVQNGATAGFVTAIKLDYDGSVLTVGEPKTRSTACTTAPNQAQWTLSGGSILASSVANATYHGNVLITVKGPYFG